MAGYLNNSKDKKTKLPNNVIFDKSNSRLDDFPFLVIFIEVAVSSSQTRATSARPEFVPPRFRVSLEYIRVS